jgi:hypothetical protein
MFRLAKRTQIIAQARAKIEPGGEASMIARQLQRDSKQSVERAQKFHPGLADESL